MHGLLSSVPTGLPPAQLPAVQDSLEVQAFPSSQLEPFGFAGFEQAPVLGLQVPTSWHWSLAEQATGFSPVQVPAWQVSDCVQASPSLQSACEAQQPLATETSSR